MQTDQNNLNFIDEILDSINKDIDDGKIAFIPPWNRDLLFAEPLVDKSETKKIRDYWRKVASTFN